MSEKREHVSNPTTDADRLDLAKLRNNKHQELLKAESAQKTIIGSKKDKGNRLSDIEHRITVLGNEVAILDRTITIYDATYDEPWRSEKADELQKLWEELEGTFKSDKMRKLLDYLWSQLQQDVNRKPKQQ